MDYTTRLLLQKPDPDPITGDFLDVSVLNANFDKLDAAMSFTPATSTARPATPFQGQAILETDTGKANVWGGSSWIPVHVGTLLEFSRLGLGAGPSGSQYRLLQTWGLGGGATSQVLLRTSSSANGHRAIATMGGTDTMDRWWVDFDGSMQWAPAGAGGDVSLKRVSTRRLGLEGWLSSERPGSGDWGLATYITGEAQPRWVIRANGDMTWGDGVTNAGDTWLRRTGAGVLRTDGTMEVLPAQGPGSIALSFNHGYTLYVDNAGAGGNNTRVWLDGPDGGEFIVGPRSGSALFGNIRLRTSDTTASAANVHMDASHIVYRVTSTLKSKVNVGDLATDSRTLLQLRPVRFQDKREYTRDGDRAKWHVGLIAEEVDALGLKEFVHYDNDGEPEGVQYERLSVALLAIVQDLATRVTALEAS